MNKLLALLLVLFLSASQARSAESTQSSSFKRALPGYVFSFPKDHASHNQYQTEWWYFTGHLNGSNQSRYGFELTFFRQARSNQSTDSRAPKNIYLAHFAITDQQSRKFHYFEKLSRTAQGLAGASADTFNVHNENWSVVQQGNKLLMKADAPEFGIDLTLEPTKPPSLHGTQGVFPKADCTGCASHYYSLSRLKTSGTLRSGTTNIKVEGFSWMDHEFGTNQLSANEIGWDWFSIQLDNNTELMLYTFRKADGTYNAHSAGSLISASGVVRPLKFTDFTISPKGTWKSPTGKGSYPMGWIVSVPPLKLKLDLDPILQNQEIVPVRTRGLGYWEGQTTVSGVQDGKQISGQAYVEMTGYTEKFKKKI